MRCEGNQNPGCIGGGESNRLGRASTPGTRRFVPDKSVRPTAFPKMWAYPGKLTLRTARDSIRQSVYHARPI